MVESVPFEEKDGVEFAESGGGSPGSVREDHGDFLGNAVLFGDVEVISGFVAHYLNNN